MTRSAMLSMTWAATSGWDEQLSHGGLRDQPSAGRFRGDGRGWIHLIGKDAQLVENLAWPQKAQDLLAAVQ